MLLLAVIVSTVFISLSKGDEYCSESKTGVNCVPCRECRDKNTICYTCPTNCKSECKDVCSDRCQKRKCEYTTGGRLKCSEGCVTGTAGLFCRELCPSECRGSLCYQLNSSCIFCEEGLTGDHCNETVSSTSSTKVSTVSASSIASVTPTALLPASTTTNPSAASTTSNPSAVTKGIDSSSNTVPLVVGLVSALSFINAVICIWYRFKKVYQMQCCCKKRSGPGRSSGERLSTVHEYNYIDENEFNSYNPHLKQESRQNSNHANHHYQNIGNMADQEAERESINSTFSGSMFGNLFELNETYSFNCQNLSDNIRDVSVYDSDRYLLPTRPNDDTDSSIV